jgi:putative spermidine/putrescine transport system substrate-binding protein
MFLKRVVQTAAGALLLSASLAASAQTAICYNCPPEWADWAAQIKAIKDRPASPCRPTTRTAARPWPS